MKRHADWRPPGAAECGNAARREYSSTPLFGRRRVRQRSVAAQSGVSRAHANAASPCHHWECSNLLEAVLEGTCKKGCSGDSISRPNLPDFRAAEGLQGECCRIQPCPCRMPYTCIQPQSQAEAGTALGSAEQPAAVAA